MRGTSATSMPMPMIMLHLHRGLGQPISRRFLRYAYCDYTGRIVRRVKTSVCKGRTRKPAKPRKPGKALAAHWSLQRFKGLQLLQLAPFKKISWLVHGFSTRLGGVSLFEGQKVLNLSFTNWDARESVVENRRLFQAALGAKELALVSLKQIHSDLIHIFPAAPAEPCKGDASASNLPGLLLGVQTADCVPILLVDPKKRAVAAIHAGWRGAADELTANTVRELYAAFGTEASDIYAAIGPCIRPCCYEVGEEVAARFSAQFPEWGREDRAHIKLDLP